MASGLSTEERGIPGGSQYGARWNHVGTGYEYSFSFFDGQNNLPLFNATFNPLANSVTLQRYYPELRLYGADLAVPLPWVTVKGGGGLLHFAQSSVNRPRASISERAGQLRALRDSSWNGR